MERLSSAEALFIIAHGSGSGFYAENERASYVIFDNSIFSAFPSFELKQKPLIITTACYGGSLAELTVPAVVGTKIVDKTKPPLVPIIMRKGGLVYIGSTSVLVAPTIFTGKGGNVMFSEIIVNALKKGKTIGAAFLEAQNEMSRGGFFAMEGSYEIQLYGDPTLKFKIG